MSNQNQPFGHLHQGGLHDALNIPRDQPITQAELDAAMAKAHREGNTHLEHMVQFAENARHFNHSGAEHMTNAGHESNDPARNGK